MKIPNKISSFAPLLLMSVMMFISCDQQIQNSKNITSEEVMNADIAFADMSRQVGMKKAFLQYIDNDGVLLRPDHLPVKGADAIDFISVLSDTSYNLSWTPMHAEIAKSGDLGYTYGVYQLKLKDSTISGTYVNIWKKENDGSWKFVLNSNNAGIR